MGLTLAWLRRFLVSFFFFSLFDHYIPSITEPGYHQLLSTDFGGDIVLGEESNIISSISFTSLGYGSRGKIWFHVDVYFYMNSCMSFSEIKSLIQLESSKGMNQIQ